MKINKANSKAANFIYTFGMCYAHMIHNMLELSTNLILKKTLAFDIKLKISWEFYV